MTITRRSVTSRPSFEMEVGKRVLPETMLTRKKVGYVNFVETTQ